MNNIVKIKCWICDAPAETGEHKIKKSLLISIHGKGPFINDNALSHVKEGKETILQGPDSKKIKYQNCLCHNCNNTGTQKFDFAYDIFFAYVYANKEKILKYRTIDFYDVYGETWEDEQRYLFKYFVKMLGCDLADSNMPVPNDLRSLLKQESFETGLRISFAVNEDKVLLGKDFDGMLGVGSMVTSQRNLETKDDPIYKWDIHFSFLHINYWYLSNIDGCFGAPWIADNQFIYLGSFHPLSEESRKELLEKLKQSST